MTGANGASATRSIADLGAGFGLPHLQGAVLCRRPAVTEAGCAKKRPLHRQKIELA